MPRSSAASTASARATSGPSTSSAPTNSPPGTTRRKDGKHRDDGESFFVLGIDHPYAVIRRKRRRCCRRARSPCASTPSAAGARSRPARTSARSSATSNDLLVRARQRRRRARAIPKEIIHVSANPKYGSEKKGAPTALLPGRRAGAHAGELRPAPRQRRALLRPEGVHAHQSARRHGRGRRLVWESDEDGEQAWERIPPLGAASRSSTKKIRVFTLPGFDIARRRPTAADLQLRMQGNAFLGAFFTVSPLLQEFGITEEQFREVVHKQYVKKFGKLGDAVVKSNMEVMIQGFERVEEIKIGALDAPDRSSHARRGAAARHATTAVRRLRCRLPVARRPPQQEERTPLIAHRGVRRANSAPASATTSPPRRSPRVGIMAAGHRRHRVEVRRPPRNAALHRRELHAVHGVHHGVPGHRAAELLAGPAAPFSRRRSPTTSADPASAQDADRGAARRSRRRTRAHDRARSRRRSDAAAADPRRRGHQRVDGFSPQAKRAVLRHHRQAADGLSEGERHLRARRSARRRASGGIFSIFVSDLCKGCGDCVTACGDHDALRDGAGDRGRQRRARDRHGLPRSAARHAAEVPRPLQRRRARRTRETATLRNMLMVRRNYDALVSGDGACAGCGEKCVLRALASVTEAYMRPLYHAKADRLRGKADRARDRTAPQRSRHSRRAARRSTSCFRKARRPHLMGLGGEDDADTDARAWPRTARISDERLRAARSPPCCGRTRSTTSDLQAVDGRLANGMSRDGDGRAHRAATPSTAPRRRTIRIRIRG